MAFIGKIKRKFAYTTIGKYQAVILTCLYWKIKRKTAYTTIGKYQTVILTWLLLDKAEVRLHNDWKISDCHAYMAFIGEPSEVFLHKEIKIFHSMTKYVIPLAFIGR